MADALEAGGPGSSTLDVGLVSWWRGEWNAVDSVGPNNGTVQGGVTFVPGKVGQAFEFNGTSGDLLMPTSTTLDLAQGFSLAFWIKVPALPVSNSAFIMCKWVDATEQKSIQINPDGTIGLYLYDVAGSSVMNSTTALTVNTWHHVTATYDGTDQSIYIDGQFDASMPASGNIRNSVGPLSFAHNAGLAALYSFDAAYFAGDLDEIRWYSRALSASEVAALGSPTPLNVSLVSWWRGEGNANDSVGPNSGSVQGGVTFVPGKVGQAFEFDGTSGDLLMPASTTLNLARGFTIAFWIKVPRLPAPQPAFIMCKWVNAVEQKSIQINPDGTVALYLYDVAGSSVMNSVTALTVSTWHYVAATYDGSTQNIYIDGQLDASTPASGNVANGAGTLGFAHNAGLAALYSFDAEYFAGDLDEIRWYSRALSGSEVEAVMAAD